MRGVAPVADQKVQNSFMHLRIAMVFAVTLVGAVPGAAQTMRAEDLAQGKIIVTPRDAPDPHFARSVILLARYDRSGALGLMIHRRTDIPVRRALAGVGGVGDRGELAYIGGPVELGMVFALVRSPSPGGDAKPVAGNIYLMASKPSIVKAHDPAEMRVFLGYAGWAPGQLESEVRRSGWYIFDFDEGLVFDAHPETLWDRLIARTERRLAGWQR